MSAVWPTGATENSGIFGTSLVHGSGSDVYRGGSQWLSAFDDGFLRLSDLRTSKSTKGVVLLRLLIMDKAKTSGCYSAIKFQTP